MWQRLIDHLALTSTERKVILFLAGTLLLGAGIRLYKETFPHPKRFDYSVSDSTFEALSRKLLSDSLATRHAASSSTVDLNAASKQDLMRLPGIGEIMAGRILELRKKGGSFQHIDELLQVKGITKKRLEQMRNFVTIDTTIETREQ